ncbi:DNA topoisomerase-3 [Sulfobacillus thermosulfidooxidans DSM 9293]|uniref:DNA topoisomerase n=1 Tax=Sulfobacillus thermosulfidooxidans (strain DSM 9293 / VKM B-1269 / AT-1) TaxID=929705 RepID=A0A1W1WL17_SULTA|nr:type IA DNA topoisomerase [Sulfobacillus thermosulfidooxidans]SMC06879.1 DNA topoisomerase-3 [Sulfobacillus thermosulfidooxidans DSM 9293]
MICIVAEKPSVARDIAGVLGHPEKHDGYLIVGHYTITWAFGHLVTLADPEVYDPAWARWTWATLPMLPERFQLVPIAKSQTQLKVIHRLMQKADRIICATDADREGELIFRYIYRLAGLHKPVERLWLSENTPQAIQSALAAMKPLSAFNALAQAAEARAQADWLVGLNATRAVTLRHGVPGQGALSVGRVQTPTLALIAARDAEIAAFMPTPYWQVAVTFQAPQGEYVGLWTDQDTDRVTDKTHAQRVVERVPPGTPGTILSVERQRVTVHPPLLFSLNDLQKEAHRRFGMTAQQTLDAAQALYEKRLTSYPRTDARVLTHAIAETVPDRLHTLPETYQAWTAACRVPTRLINDQKVAEAGHYAIIPTAHGGPIPPLSDAEQHLYDLIIRRFIAALMPTGEDERITIRTQAGGEHFITKGTVIITEGWRAVLKDVNRQEAVGEEQEEIEERGPIPAGLHDGESVEVHRADVQEKTTKAPPRLNDATLLGLMEKHGLGTPATRARIVEVLLARGYVQRQKKALVSTAKGQALLQVLPAAIQSPELTGQWEAQLETIAAGTGSVVEFMTKIRAYTQELVTAAQIHAAQAIGTDLGACPVCHQGRIVAGKKAWGCSRWREGCTFTIWKTVAGKTLTESQVKTLLVGKTTSELKGFTSKTGKPFSAKLRLVDGKIQFVFESPKKHRA